jgi:alpha-L-fucosidase
MIFEPTRESLAMHRVPAWYHEAKFGILIHWGLYSVPAWAPIGVDVQTLIKRGGMKALMQNNPYAEWYLNSMKLKEHPTCQHHQNSYGSGFQYFDFQPIFEQAAAAMDPAKWAETFREAGARYVVMVTKHHDGYPLWPTRHPNPLRDNYSPARDFVGELTVEVRKRGLRMGHYYSGVLDWTFNTKPIRDYYSFLTNQRQSTTYIDYANAHWREIIERYRPDVLWNDIGYPYGTNVLELMAHYYNTVPEGVVNDRWTQTKVPRNPAGRLLMRASAGNTNKKIKKEGLDLEPRCHHDFRTPEYTTYPDIREEKWETCRGIGHSFGYNQLEGEHSMISGVDLIRSLVDTVSKNGNMLLNVGPMADGSIPEMQRRPLVELGAWLSRNGEAIYGTGPWLQAEGRTAEGHDLRFTQAAKAVYVTVMETTTDREFTMPKVPLGDVKGADLLGRRAAATMQLIDGGIRVILRTDSAPRVVPVIRFSR